MVDLDDDDDQGSDYILEEEFHLVTSNRRNKK